MPFVTIQMWEGRSPEDKAAIIEKVTDALVDAMGVERRYVQVVLDEYSKDNWGIGGQSSSVAFPD